MIAYDEEANDFLGRSYIIYARDLINSSQLLRDLTEAIAAKAIDVLVLVCSLVGEILVVAATPRDPILVDDAITEVAQSMVKNHRRTHCLSRILRPASSTAGKSLNSKQFEAFPVYCLLEVTFCCVLNFSALIDLRIRAHLSTACFAWDSVRLSRLG